MKQRFDHVAPHRARPRPGPGSPVPGAAPATEATTLEASPDGAGSTWLSEALKVWCAERHDRP